MNLTAYLISIVAISLVTIIIEMALPEGNMARFARKIVALFVIFIVIAPLPSLIKNKKISLNNTNNNAENYIDINLISSIYSKRAEILEDQIESELRENQLNANVDIPLDLTSKEFKVNFVSVFILSGELNEQSIKDIVKKYVLVANEQIIIS